jgi:hypothetical protein
MMSRLLPLHRIDRRIAALGWVLRVFLSKTLTGHGKCPKRPKIGACLDAIYTFVAGVAPQSIPVN